MAGMALPSRGGSTAGGGVTVGKYASAGRLVGVVSGIVALRCVVAGRGRSKSETRFDHGAAASIF
jgi:hypothetical protein